jgi:hypothetical protein
VLLIAALLGIVGGLLAGGHLLNLLSVRLRFGLLILLALAIRIGTQALIERDVAIVDQGRTLLFALSFGMLITALWLNRAQPGLLLAMVGVSANAVAILVNGGYMPVYVPAVEVVGLTASNLSPSFHVALPLELGLEFLLDAGPLGDILPIAIPFLANVVSIGDVLLAAGVAWFLFTAIAHGTPDPDAGVVTLWSSHPRAYVGIERLGGTRPVVLGSGMGPGLRAAAAMESSPVGAADITVGLPARTLGQRVAAHPYVHLARDARFSAFWLASVVSMFGDRLHQIALGVMVLAVTGSALQTGLVFLAATLPNLVLGPIAGTFVDRWDQKRVMIASDLIRAGLVAAIPFIVEVSVWLVYPLAFLVTTVSLFFRPAKAAIVPRIVPRSDLMPANGALLSGEALAFARGGSSSPGSWSWAWPPSSLA